MIDLDLIRDWLETAEHKPHCERHYKNIYSSGGECNCGLENAKKELEKLTDFVKSITK